MTATLHIDFVSDIACPWCAVGLHALEAALQRLSPDITAELHFQPFELNPDMPPEGADATTYLRAKYRLGDEDLARNRELIRERGAAVGFTFGERAHVWNTFDAHRLLQWAAQEGPAGSARALKHALLQAYHGEGRNPGAREVLLELAAQVGLDPGAAAAVLDAGRYGAEVHAAESDWQRRGIRSVPAVIVNDRHLIAGAQPSEVFEQALREIAASA